MLLRVGRADFLASLASWKLDLLERKISAIQAAPCLLGVERRLLRPLAERMVQEKVHARTLLIKQGAEPSRVYIIASGEARVLMKSEGSGEVLQVQQPERSNARRREHAHVPAELTRSSSPLSPLQVATLGPGALFGEIGVVLQCPHTASVISCADMTLYRWRSQTLEPTQPRGLPACLSPS